MPSRIATQSLCVLTLALALALTSPTPARAVDLTGCWQGTWESCSTGHHGPLEATFTRCSDTSYQVTFTGRFLRFIPFRYTVKLDAVATDGISVALAGSSFLGRLFGTFRYSATADERRFDANYTSKKDDGVFRLHRTGG